MPKGPKNPYRYLMQCPYFQQATDASLRADYFLRSALSCLKNPPDPCVKEVLGPSLARWDGFINNNIICGMSPHPCPTIRLLHNRDHIHREMSYSYQGPDPHLLSSSLQHVLLQHQHLSIKVQQVCMKLLHLAGEACQLHVEMLEARNLPVNRQLHDC